MSHRVFFFFFLFTLQSCIDITDNKNEILKERTEYQGIKNCILFIKSGGATVGDSYQISIMPYQDKLKDSDTGNIFIADGQALSRDTSSINFEWISFDTLRISFDKNFRVFKMNTKIKDVTIVYDSLTLTK